MTRPATEHGGEHAAQAPQASSIGSPGPAAATCSTRHEFPDWHHTGGMLHVLQHRRLDMFHAGDTTDGSAGTDEARVPHAEAEGLGSDARTDADAGGKAGVRADILPPPGPARGGAGAATTSVPKLLLPAAALAAPPPRTANKLPKDTAEILSQGPSIGAPKPMKINAQHVVGKVATVRDPCRPVKKRPLWSDDAAQAFNPWAPVKMTVPEILYQAPTACVPKPMKINAQHVVGRVAVVKDPIRPVKKRPLWPDDAAQAFNPWLPVKLTIPKILLQGPPASVLRF